MIRLCCPKCSSAVLVAGRPDQLRVARAERATCLEKGCDGLLEENNSNLGGGKVMVFDQFYRAVNGYGCGVSAPAPVEAVNRALFEKKVTSVSSRTIGQPERTILEAIGFEDGTILHFCSSNEGACVYLIEVPQ